MYPLGLPIKLDAVLTVVASDQLDPATLHAHSLTQSVSSHTHTHALYLIVPHCDSNDDDVDDRDSIQKHPPFCLFISLYFDLAIFFISFNQIRINNLSSPPPPPNKDCVRCEMGMVGSEFVIANETIPFRVLASVLVAQSTEAS